MTFEMAKSRNGAALGAASIVIMVGVLATTLAQPQALARLPLQNLLKNELQVGPAANAAFFFWSGLPWYFKPIAGVLTDAFPLFGSRRRSYILISAVLASLAWVGLWFTPHDYNSLLWVCIALNAFLVTASTVVGGYMVEVAQASSGSGRLTAIRQFVQQACTIIMGPASGWLAAISFGWTALACGGVMFLLVPVTIWFLHEQRRKATPAELLGDARLQMRAIVDARTMWAAAGLMALFYIAPGIGTAVFYKQQNDLGMSTQAQGWLVLISGSCGIVASFGYGLACRRFNLRRLLVFAMAFGTAANLGYLFYSSVPNARVIEGFNGFGFTLAELALMDLAVRATPKGSEGLGFALMMAVRNLATSGTDWFGSSLYEAHRVTFDALVIANSATTAITIPLVFLLPRLLLDGTDGAVVEAPAPKGEMA
jgi:hypothetical protein